MKVVFFGTPQFAVPPLKALLKSKHEVVAAVSQPDRAKDRKGRLIPTPLKAAAEEAGIKVFQFESVKKEAEILKALGADIFVTAAYGQILSQEILDIAPHGVINIHGSLLPLYRGSSPVQHAILNGEIATGITIMKTELGLDCGDMILQRSVPIDDEINSAELLEKLSNLGAQMLIEALDKIEDGSAIFTPQDHKAATKCGKITKESTLINWEDSAKNIHNRVRATEGHTYLNGRLIKILKTAVTDTDYADLGIDDVDYMLVHGKIFGGKKFKVMCGKNTAIEILRLCPAGGKPMSGEDFLKGLQGHLQFDL